MKSTSKDWPVMIVGGLAMFFMMLVRVFVGGFALHVLIQVVQETYELSFTPASYLKHVGMFALFSAVVTFLMDPKGD